MQKLKREITIATEWLWERNFLLHVTRLYTSVEYQMDSLKQL